MNRRDDARRPRRMRLAAAAVVSAGLLVPLAAFGASSNGQSPSAAQYKITICHHTHSKKHPTVTISISNKAWPAHQRHGDTLGACAASSKSNHGKSGSHPSHPSHPSTPSQGQNGSGGNPGNPGKGHGK
jgi:hypothetical protein